MKPITSLNRIFKKAQEGDLAAQAESQSNDEIGDLAVSYNRMIDRLKLYDELKSKKIVVQKRTIDRLLENLDVPVCILNEKLFALYYNMHFTNLFGSSLPAIPPSTGLELARINEVRIFMEELQSSIKLAKNNFEFRTLALDGSIKAFKGRLVRDQFMNLVSIVVVGTESLDGEGGQ